jgi:hypothetical protein
MIESRRTIIFAVFCLCCLLSSARLVKDAPTPGHFATSEIAVNSDQRFAALKAALPSHGVVGYIGEPGNSGLADYYLAQYALAPLVLDRSTNHPLVLGSFPTSPPGQAWSNTLHLQRDFGSGIMLFASEGAK